MRVAQYIGQSGFTSRQKAKLLIDEKRVTVNDKTATQSTTINDGDIVLVDGLNINSGSAPDIVVKKPQTIKNVAGSGAVYIAYNKPKGIVCTTEKIEGNIIDAIGYKGRILPVGRLDKDSEGLILLTSNSSIIDKIVNPKYGHEKEYLVTLNLPVSTSFIKAAEEGIDIGNSEVTQPCTIKIEPGTKRIFRVVLKQGLNRQIRRMCNKFDYQVIKLQRVRVMHVSLNNLQPGEWRVLSTDEVEQLFHSLG